MALPADTIISFWKPEVSVKLVADFSRYPEDFGQLLFLLLFLLLYY